MSCFLKFLGCPAVIVGTKEISAFRSNRIPALLGLLASRPGPTSRVAAATLLWPDKDGEAARHNLRQTVLYSRQLLGEEAIVGDRNTLSLAAGISHDAEALLRDSQDLESPAESIRAAERIVETDGATFLEGIEDEWVQAVRHRAAHGLLSALLVLSESLLASDPERAYRLASRAAELEPYLDRVRAKKILALRRMGDEAAAHREFRAYRELLLSDLRIEPSPAVKEALEGSLEEAEASGPRGFFAFDQLEAMVRAERPVQALDLVAACVPVWVNERTGGRAADYVKELLTSCAHLEGLASYQRALVSLADLTIQGGHYYEARHLLEGALEGMTDRPSQARAHVRLALMFVSAYRNDLAEPHIRSALALKSDDAWPEISAQAYRAAASHSYESERFAEGAAMAEACAELASSMGDRPLYLGAACLRAEGQLRLGQRDRAKETALAALHQAPSAGSPRAAGFRMQIYRLLEEMGESEQALNGYYEELRELRESEDVFGLAIGLTYLGDLLTTYERYAESLESHQEALAQRHRIRDYLGEATSLRGMGRVYLRTGRLDEAAAVLQRSAQLFQECSADPGYASAMVELARTAVARSDYPVAKRCAQQALRLLLGMSPAKLRANGPTGEALVTEAQFLLAAIGG